MEKMVKIGDVEIKLSNNVAWTMEYRDQFNKDIMETLLPIVTTLIETVSTIVSDSEMDGTLSIKDISEAVQGRAFELTLPLAQLGFTDSVTNIVWAMAKAADSRIDPPKQWVRQFDSFPLDEIIPEVFGMIKNGFISSKNSKWLTSAAKGLMSQPEK